MPLPVWEIHRRNLVILQMVAALLLYCLLIHGLQNKQNKTAAVLCYMYVEIQDFSFRLVDISTN